MIAILLAFLLNQTPRDAASQQPPAGTAVIGGIVRTETGGAIRPLRRAIVSISGTGIYGLRQTVTDETGRFLFDRLSPGRFTLVAEKPGYLKTYYGSKRAGRPPGSIVALIDGQRLLDVSISVPMGAVVDGTVRDETGAPIAGSQVMVQLMTFAFGQRKFISAGAGPAWAVTDDRGHYRLWGLPPGEYTVRASGGQGAFILTAAEYKAVETQFQTGRAPAPGANVAGPALQRGIVYYPGVPDIAQAQTITLGVGEERMGIDLVNAPVASFGIEYVAIGPSGRPITAASVAIASVSRQSLFTSPGIFRTDEAGRGSMRGLPPGRYLFSGRGTESNDPGAPVYWVDAEVDVTGADATVTLQFLPGQRVTGRIQSSGSALPALTSTARVQLNPVPLIAGSAVSTPTGAINADGTFSVANVQPGRYRLEVGGVTGWTAATAGYQNVDTLDFLLEVRPSVDVEGVAVTVTDRLTEISGLITDVNGRPTPELSVMVFPEDRALWASPRRFSGAVRVGSDGKYRISALPPGNYLLAVVADIDPLTVNDPTVLEQLMTGAVRISLTNGQKAMQDLKIGG